MKKQLAYERRFKDILWRRALVTLLVVVVLFGITSFIGMTILKENFSTNYDRSVSSTESKIRQEFLDNPDAIDSNTLHFAICRFAVDEGEGLTIMPTNEYCALIDNEDGSIVLDSECSLVLLNKSVDAGSDSLFMCSYSEFEPYYCENCVSSYQGDSQFRLLKDYVCSGQLEIADYYIADGDIKPVRYMYTQPTDGFSLFGERNAVTYNEGSFVLRPGQTINFVTIDQEPEDDWIFVEETDGTTSAHVFVGTKPNTDFIREARELALATVQSSDEDKIFEVTGVISLPSLDPGFWQYEDFGTTGITASDGHEYTLVTYMRCNNLFSRIDIIMYGILILYVVAALIVLFVSTAVTARKNKYRRATEDYRKGLVNGMASDLKEPLSKLAEDSASLEGTIATGASAEAAMRIGEDVTSMNNIINDILTRSEQEFGAKGAEKGKK